MTRALSVDELAVIVTASRLAGRALGAEDRYDLRQELALKLLAKPAPPEDLLSSLTNWARAWVADFVASRANQRAILRELHAAGGAPRGYRVGANWWPKWYPPSKNAEEHAPFACHGARVMAVKAEVHSADMESVMNNYLDSVGVFRRARKKSAQGT